MWFQSIDFTINPFLVVNHSRNMLVLYLLTQFKFDKVLAHMIVCLKQDDFHHYSLSPTCAPTR